MTRRGFLFAGWGAWGALDAGLFHALRDAGMTFELVAGEGAGAVNAAAIAAGVGPHDLGQKWLEAAGGRPGWLERRVPALGILAGGAGVFRFRRDLWRLPRWRGPLALSPLAETLARDLSEDAVRRSPTRLWGRTFRLDTGESEVFRNDWFRIEHALASCAVPHLIAPVSIDRAPHCDPALLAATSPLAALALDHPGVDELYFPLLIADPTPGRHGVLRTLAIAFTRGLTARLERDLALLRGLPPGRAPRLVPLTVRLALPAQSPVDYRRAAIHALLDRGYDEGRRVAREAAESVAAAAPGPAAAGPTPPRKTPQKPPGKAPRKKAVRRLRKALRGRSSKPRKEPSLGF